MPGQARIVLTKMFKRKLLVCCSIMKKGNLCHIFKATRFILARIYVYCNPQELD